MRVFSVTEAGKFEFSERAIPELKTEEVLLKIKRLGYCGSDLNTWRGLNPMVSYPRIIGHEISGVIEKIGTDVPGDFRAGQLATVIPYTTCGKCAACRQGRANACRYNETYGVQRDGAFSEYLAVPWQKLLVKEKLTLDQLVMVEPISVGFHGVKRARVTENDTVAVFGCGMIGIGAVVGAASRNARVIAIDIDDNKLELARQSGATDIINSTTDNLHERLLELTGGHGPEVMIEAVGLPLTFRQAVEEVAFAGRVVYIGYAKKPVEYETKLFVQKELDILGSRNADKDDFEAVVNAIRSGRVSIDKLITIKVPFGEAGNALDDMV